MKTFTFAFFLIVLTGSVAYSQDMIYPVIQGYGGVHEIPFKVEKPDASLDYKLVTELFQGSKEKGEPYGSLDYVARLVNAHALAGIPNENLDLAVIIYSGAAFTFLNHAEFNKRFGTDNPNLEVIQRLQDAGVKIIVCGQSMMKQNLLPEQIHSDVILSSSRIVALSERLKNSYQFISSQ